MKKTMFELKFNLKLIKLLFSYISFNWKEGKWEETFAPPYIILYSS